MELIHKTDSKLLIETDIELTEVPKCDLFSCKEAWIVLDAMPASGEYKHLNFSRCAFQKLIKVNFKEKTMFQNIISEKCELGLQWTSEEWFKIAKNNGHFLPQITIYSKGAT